jgi:hypothetical protein
MMRHGEKSSILFSAKLSLQIPIIVRRDYHTRRPAHKLYMVCSIKFD